jgi:DNA repair exonuclease SbcCD ATPase subunit
MTDFKAALATLEDQREDARINAASMRGRLDHATEDLEEARMRKERAEYDAQLNADALDILRAYAELQEKVVRERVETIVTEGLQAVFERDDIEFAFEFALKRGQMTATPIIRTRSGKDVVETEATDARGGGVLDVAAFLLRCVMLVLIRPQPARVLILDETFKHLSRNHLPNAGELVKRMSDRLGIQIILVSHKDEFAEVADRVFDVTITNGETSIEAR